MVTLQSYLSFWMKRRIRWWVSLYSTPVRAFWLRRPFLILRGVLARRDRPDLERLARIDDPETFIWAILPHAARTFAACIAMLPARSALPAAVAYLYCRILDTYEDLVPDVAARDASLRAFAERLNADAGAQLAPAPAIADATDRDDRDRAHLLLVRRAHLVDHLYLSFDAPTRHVVRDLVRDMAEGMRWSSGTFERQGGVLVGEDQLAAYCRHVLGNPVVFGVRLLRLARGARPELSAAEREDAMRVGELVQLANVTRDVEKDLRRGIAYDALLRDDLGRDVNGDRALAERCRVVRERLLRMALARAPSYARIIEAIEHRGWSIARASGVLMLLFTERYYRGCTRRVGLPVWDGPSSTAALLARTIRSMVSRQAAFDEIARIESAFLAAARH
jgi:phytoene/squalene synthetase